MCWCRLSLRPLTNSTEKNKKMINMAAEKLKEKTNKTKNKKKHEDAAKCHRLSLRPSAIGLALGPYAAKCHEDAASCLLRIFGPTSGRRREDTG